MTSRSESLIIVLFGLSLLIGVVFGVLAFLTLLPTFSLATPYIFAFTLFAVGTVIAAALAAFAKRYEDRIEGIRNGICKCISNYGAAIIVSAIILLIVLLIFISVAVTAILNAILIGLIALFFFFLLFTLAALIFCLLDEACEKKCDCDDSRN